MNIFPVRIVQETLVFAIHCLLNQLLNCILREFIISFVFFYFIFRCHRLSSSIWLLGKRVKILDGFFLSLCLMQLLGFVGSKEIAQSSHFKF